ncbi:MAG TPA: nuclease [Rhizobiales bacterium]|nr:nuclease [Hyphomicrobiales bacterium]
MQRGQVLTIAAAGLGLLVMGASGAAGKTAYLAGPVLGYLERVVDGDTIHARALIWLHQEVRVTVRLKGVDTPELHGRCAREIAMARRARRFTANWLAGGPIRLTRIKQGKYGGRVIAKIANAKGQDLGRALLNEGLARPYGGAKRRSWCLDQDRGQPALSPDHS